MTQSTLKELGPVPFPSFSGERVYMLPFRKTLPAALGHWQETVDAMLDGLTVPGKAYLMIDQAFVPAGSTQRRPGMHVDGYWHEGVSCHGGVPSGPASHWHSPPSHRGYPQGGHGPYPSGTHGAWPQGHSRHAFGGEAAEALLLATTDLGCIGYDGEYSDLPGEGGDCGHFARGALSPVPFLAGRCYAGHTLTMLHESIPVARDCYRTVVRLNVPGLAL